MCVQAAGGALATPARRHLEHAFRASALGESDSEREATPLPAPKPIVFPTPLAIRPAGPSAMASQVSCAAKHVPEGAIRWPACPSPTYT